MDDLSDDEKEVWDILKYGPPLYELYNVNTFIADDREIVVHGYININNKRDFKITITVDGSELEKSQYRYYPDAIRIKDCYPTSCHILIHDPVSFECMITMAM